MRDLSKLPKVFDYVNVKRAYRVNTQKAKRIIDDFIANKVVEQINDFKFKKIEKTEQILNKNVEVKNEIKEPVTEPKEEVTNKVETVEVKEVKESDPYAHKVHNSVKPIPYEVETTHGTFMINACNYKDLCNIVNNNTNHMGKIKNIKGLR